MGIAYSHARLGSTRSDQHLHREKLGEHKMLACCVVRFPGFWKMNRTNCGESIATGQLGWQQGFQRRARKFVWGIDDNYLNRVQELMSLDPDQMLITDDQRQKAIDVAAGK